MTIALASFTLRAMVLLYNVEGFLRIKERNSDKDTFSIKSPHPTHASQRLIDSTTDYQLSSTPSSIMPESILKVEGRDPTASDGVAPKNSILQSDIAVEPEKLDDIFGLWTLCFMAVVLTNTWGFAASSLTLGIFGGGPAVQIWGTLAIGLVVSTMAASLAEMASSYPSPAGCTHAAAQLAGPRWGRLMVINRSLSLELY